MSSNNLLSFVGWTFLPNLVTGWTQTIWYGLTIRAGDPKPQPGSPRWSAHRRRIYVLVVSLYLLYTIYEADHEIRRQGDFYQLLGVSPDAEDRLIKSKFRRMAAMHHPDKISSAEHRAYAEVFFLRLKQAQDVLLDPVKRFAYDRFGPEISEWANCASIGDYVTTGLQSIIPMYFVGFLVLAVMMVFGYLPWGRYWRFIAFASLLAFEVHTVTRPYFPAITTRVFNPLFVTFTKHPPYLPFQQLTLFRKVALTVYIALSQLGPIIQQMQQPQNPQEAQAAALGREAQQRQRLDRLEQLTQVTDAETRQLLGLEMAPFWKNSYSAADFRSRLQDWLVQNTVRSDPEIRDAVGRVVERRRAGAPAGAQGTKTGQS